MRRAHFDALRPVCVVCRSAEPLVVGRVVREHDDDVIEGILTCVSPGCQREYPVIDGIPVLVGPIRSWLSANPLQILARTDLSPELESLLGDVLGSGSQFDTTRQHVGIYAADHYVTRSAEQVLDAAMRHVAVVGRGILDAGCSVGGTTFALAEATGAITLGVDLNFAMLRVASRALREGRVQYARRRVGLAYDRQEIDVPRSDLVDFWCADVASLPFAHATFSLTSALHLIDCVNAPRETLLELARVTRDHVLLATPYDWSTAATPVESWLGGHSQRGPHRGASEPVLRALLSEAGLELAAEEEHVPWRVRLHERSSVDYDVHVIVARRKAREVAR